MPPVPPVHQRRDSLATIKTPVKDSPRSGFLLRPVPLSACSLDAATTDYVLSPELAPTVPAGYTALSDVSSADGLEGLTPLVIPRLRTDAGSPADVSDIEPLDEARVGEEHEQEE
eukprot:Hpha_TRINITY_DN28500_c0_g1::TRINITY_DN28500_c0_g1_i1::g.18596::m.18596